MSTTSGNSTTTAAPEPSAVKRVLAWAVPALAVIAVAVAGAAWFRAGQGNSPHFNDDQTAQAKTQVCAAYTSVRGGVVANTHRAIPNPNDPTSQLAVAANARLALLGGGAYLRERLAAAPAAPADLATAASAMATTIEQLGINYLAAADPALQQPLRHDLDGQIKQLNDLCK